MKGERLIAASFALSAISSLGLVVLYLLGGDAQLEGVLLGAALLGLGAGLIVWAGTLLADGAERVVEERARLYDAPEDPRDSSESSPKKFGKDPRAPGGATSAIDATPVTRRAALVKLMTAAGAALGGALAIPALSLGPRPGQSLFRTAWAKGKRLVDTDGSPMRVTDILPGTVRTVFPEGELDSEDAQTLVVRVDPDTLELASERTAWAPEGVVGYSKICTHAGCPVGLYRAESHELLCPCHQSTFDVLRGATPTFGPADRPLPQLPIEVDEEGYLVAGGDFSEPVGPGFWNLESDR